MSLATEGGTNQEEETYQEKTVEEENSAVPAAVKAEDVVAARDEDAEAEHANDAASVDCAYLATDSADSATDSADFTFSQGDKFIFPDDVFDTLPHSRSERGSRSVSPVPFPTCSSTNGGSHVSCGVTVSSAEQIRIATLEFGMLQMHLVSEEHSTFDLIPHPESQQLLKQYFAGKKMGEVPPGLLLTVPRDSYYISGRKQSQLFPSSSKLPQVEQAMRSHLEHASNEADNNKTRTPPIHPPKTRTCPLAPAKNSHLPPSKLAPPPRELQ